MDSKVLHTLHNHNMFEISSMVQKAIRRGLIDDAFYSANEMIAHFRSYLWKRLLTASSEDCHDLLSAKLLKLHREDDSLAIEDKSRISEAVSYLVYARKNRDVDYFACNLMNSRDKRHLTSIEPTLTDAVQVQYPTKNGHSMFDCSAALVKAVNCADYDMAGYTANELYVRYRTYFWQTIRKIARELNESRILDEINALKVFDDEQVGSKSPTPIFAAKSVVVLIKFVKYGIDVFVEHEYPFVDIYKYDSKYMMIPSYVYDCHTWRGKQLGKTKRDFVVEEQKGLRPKVVGEFDDSSWERFFELEKIGFYDANNLTPRPEKKKMKDLDKGQIQLELF